MAETTDKDPFPEDTISKSLGAFKQKDTEATRAALVAAIVTATITQDADKKKVTEFLTGLIDKENVNPEKLTTTVNEKVKEAQKQDTTKGVVPQDFAKAIAKVEEIKNEVAETRLQQAVSNPNTNAAQQQKVVANYLTSKGLDDKFIQQAATQLVTTTTPASEESIIQSANQVFTQKYGPGLTKLAELKKDAVRLTDAGATEGLSKRQEEITELDTRLTRAREASFKTVIPELVKIANLKRTTAPAAPAAAPAAAATVQPRQLDAAAVLKTASARNVQRAAERNKAQESMFEAQGDFAADVKKSPFKEQASDSKTRPERFMERMIDTYGKKDVAAVFRNLKTGAGNLTASQKDMAKELDAFHTNSRARYDSAMNKLQQGERSEITSAARSTRLDSFAKDSYASDIKAAERGDGPLDENGNKRTVASLKQEQTAFDEIRKAQSAVTSLTRTGASPKEIAEAKQEVARLKKGQTFTTAAAKAITAGEEVTAAVSTTRVGKNELATVEKDIAMTKAAVPRALSRAEELKAAKQAMQTEDSAMRESKRKTKLDEKRIPSSGALGGSDPRSKPFGDTFGSLGGSDPRSKPFGDTFGSITGRTGKAKDPAGSPASVLGSLIGLNDDARAGREAVESVEFTEKVQVLIKKELEGMKE